MLESASREILWNVGSLPQVIIMYALFGLSVVIGLIGLTRHAELWLSGKPALERELPWWEGFMQQFSWALLQKGVVRERRPGLAHTLIYLGFVVLLFTTTMVAVEHDLGIPIFRGRFYLVVTLMSDLLGFGLLIGVGLMAYRRYILKEDRLHSQPADYHMLVFLTLLIVQGFVLEGLRIHATNDPWAAYSPIGWLFARFFWFLSIPATQLLHYLMWWFHAVTVFAFIGIAPYTKAFHVLVSSMNVFFRVPLRAKGALPFPGDLEKLMETSDDFNIGLGSIKDYSWKQLLDLDACTSCGRCQSVCPAYASGKPLSPKWLILDSRNHMLALQAQDKFPLTKKLVPESAKKVDQFLQKGLYLKSSGLNYDESTQSFAMRPESRAGNAAVQNSALSIGADADHRMAGEVIDPDTFWSCTTCMACVQACPVGIQHVEQIVENRRNMVLMQGEIPQEAQGTLRALENRANPYGAPEDRSNWLQGLNVPVLQPGDEVEYLYWVGCVSAYDPRKQKIAKALVDIMNTAGISFGVLGNVEGCTGDPARRLGEENLFQTLAKQNIATLNTVRFKYLVANCPHCFNTIKNEYPQFGGIDHKPKIIHHSQLLKRLIADGKIKLQEGKEQTITFHDPCYLGRYNDEYDAPRDTLKKIKSLNIVEMERSRENGFCCGAGGGHFWMDLKIGERVNVIRTDEAANTGADTVATACPFCMQMLEDGSKLTNREETLSVRDIAEVIAENLLRP